MGRLTRLGGALLFGALLTACTSDGSESAFQPSFEEQPCPPELESVLIPTHSCGYLTVLEDRSRPSGRTIQLFVVRIEPQGGAPEGGAAMFVPGQDLAVESDFYGTANLAQRVDREVFLMDQRGTGRSLPSLDCPEIDALSAAALREGIDGASSRAAFIDAVSACRARLTGEGVDVAAYDLSAMAQDGVDLRRALGIDSWGISTYGTASLVALEMLREDPAHVDVMVLDSPEFPQDDPLTTDVAGTHEAIAAIFRACEQQARCESAYPRLQDALRRATARLDDHPVTVSTRTASGNRFDVRVDGSALLRALRSVLRWQTDALDASEPAAVNAAVHGDVASVIAPILAYAPAFCAGYLPSCDESHAVSEGTYLSVMCQGFASWADPEASPGLPEGERLYASAFANNPWVQGCAAWKVGPADPSAAQPVSSDVPMLIVRGRYDPYTPAGVVQRATETLTGSWVVTNPSGGHNALSQSCMIQIRNAWVSDPASPPDLDCLPSIREKPFVIDRS
jgi:pimeloyl-ACP methyl ester carboxylesterase